jgi:hypothetical protein
MGNNTLNSRKKTNTSNIDVKAQFIMESFRNTGVTFTEREITNLKLKTNDAENYFGTKFDYFLCYNSYLFQERINQIYDNFNSKVENCKNGVIKVLIVFDDESESENKGVKMDFDSLLTVILEKLEIESLLYFDLTNLDCNYIQNFFDQLVESIELYKYNRKYDNLFFLMPNTDYLVKYDSCLAYITNKKLKFENLEINNKNDKLKGINEKGCKLNNINNEILLNSNILSDKILNPEVQNNKTKLYPYICSDLTLKASKQQMTNKQIDVIDLKNKFIELCFAKIKKDSLLACKYLKTNHDKLNDFQLLINYINPTYVKVFIKITFQNHKPNEVKKNHIYSKSINVKDLNLKSGVRHEMKMSNHLAYSNTNSIRIEKEMDIDIFEESNKEMISTLKFLTDKLNKVKIVIDNLAEINIKNEVSYITYLLKKIIENSNNSYLDETNTSIKIILNYYGKLVKENNGEFSDNYNRLLSIEKEINKYINKLIKTKTRTFIIQIVEIIPLTIKVDAENKEAINPQEKEEINPDNHNFNVKNDIFVYKWKEKKSFNSTLLLALLAKKLGKTLLLEENIITRMSSLLSIMYFSVKSSKKTVVNKEEYLNIIY